MAVQLVSQGASSEAFFTHFVVNPPLKFTSCHENRLADSVEDEISRLRMKIRELAEENKKLQKLLQKEIKPFISERKTFEELSPARKCHKKAEITKWLTQQFEKLPTEWKVIELKMDIGGKVENLKFHDTLPNDNSGCSLEEVQKALKAKDDGDVSDLAYHELKKVPGANLPSLQRVVKERKRQNSVLRIQEFDEDIVKGCCRSITEIINYMIVDEDFKTDIDTNTSQNNTITLRFSGDGRKTTKKTGSVMTTFCIPGSSRSPEKEYCISIYDGKECHALLSSSMDRVFAEIITMQTTGFLIDNTVFFIDWLLCADWKFMALLLGINAPCSDFFCLWCECCKKLLRDFSIKDWKITRTYEQCCNRASPQFDGDKKGVINKPVMNVAFTKVIPDTLHLLLRIRGKLLNQVACWAIEQKAKEKMEAAMLSIDVKFNFYDAQESNGKTTTKWSSLDCDDLGKVIKTLKIDSFLNNMADKSKSSLDCLSKQQLVAVCKQYNLKTCGTKDTLRSILKEYLTTNKISFMLSTVQNSQKKALDVQELQMVWRDFEVLADALKANINDVEYLEPAIFKAKAVQWVNCFRRATFDEDVIPYMHVLVYHVPQFLELYGTIHQYNCQTVEKKNHLQNRTFHRNSQKGGKNSNYTVQIMQKENRGLFAKVEKLERKKRKYTKKPK